MTTNDKPTTDHKALKHAAEVALEICRAMADPEHCFHDSVKNARVELWAQWRDFFRAALAKAQA